MELVLMGSRCPLTRMEGSISLPLYLTAEYEFYEAWIRGTFCLVLHYNGHYLSPEQVRKHMSKVRQVTGLEETPCILWVDSLRKEQMEKLMEHSVPCYAGPTQFFLPFLGAVMMENKEQPIQPTQERFTVSQQRVFLAVLMAKNPLCSTKLLRQQLALSHPSVCRALLDLYNRGLLDVKGKATRKVYSRPDRRSFWEKGKGALISPVMRMVYYEDGVPGEYRLILAGESALSEHTMLAEPVRSVYAVFKGQLEKLPKSTPNEVYQMREGGEVLEVWSYDPAIFCQTGQENNRTVDPFSLYAALGEERRDERVEIELENWMEEFFKE